MIDAPLPSNSQTGEILLRVDAISASPNSSREYFAELLRLTTDVVGGECGQIWQQTQAAFEPMVKIGEGAVDSTAQREFAFEVFRSASPTVRSYDMLETDEGVDCCLLVPLLNDRGCFAVVAIDTTVENAFVAEAFLAMMAAIAERVSNRYVAAHVTSSSRALTRAENAAQVTTGISKHLELKPLAYDAVNRLQKYLEADRVSLVIRRGSKCQIKAISNQAIFDRRSRVIRELERLSTQVAKMREALWYPSADDEVSPSLRKTIERYFEASDTFGIALLPIFAEKKRRDDYDDLAATIEPDDDRQECIGVLILEGIETPLPTERIKRRWSRVDLSVSQAIANARKYDGLFMMPTWRALGSVADLYRGQTGRKAILVTLAIVAVIVMLATIPSDFKLRGEGVIQPSKRQHVYAEAEGTIDELAVADGDEVDEGQLLISLRNPELATRVAELTGKLREAETQRRTITMQRVARTFSTEQEERELVQTASSIEARIEGMEKQLALLRQAQDQLEIRSPIGGQIVTWDVTQRLRDRPVKPGQRLMTIAVPSGGWEIELRIPDSRAGYLLRQWEASESVDVSFVLASNPTQVYRGSVVEVAPSSSIDDKEHESVVRVRIELTADEFAQIEGAKPGTTVMGHVHCGRASIGYCKLYEFFDWAQRMWFKFVA